MEVEKIALPVPSSETFEYIEAYRRKHTDLEQSDMCRKLGGISANTYRRRLQEGGSVSFMRDVCDILGIPVELNTGATFPVKDPSQVSSPDEEYRVPSGDTDTKTNRESGRDQVSLRVFDAGAGPGRHTSRMVQISPTLFDETGITLSDAALVRVVGSSMEPDLSHGQHVVVEPAASVAGQDMYVYWSEEEEAHLIAEIHRDGQVLVLEKSASTRTLTPKGDDLYVDDQGRKHHIQIVGRVLGAFMRVPKQRALRREQADNVGRAVGRAFRSYHEGQHGGNGLK